jgi:phospholipid/cholesterol/gamma-HCH transport system substrate-binding protein
MTRIFGVVAGLALAVVATLLLTGSDDAYKARVLLENAGGLRSGSPVVIGGVPVGKLDLSIDDRTDKVLVEMRIKPEFGPIGKDATAEIVAQNLLGQKQLSITTGDVAGDPAPSGFELESGRVTQQTDLDQVLNVLDAPTRTRLAIFINEAGAAFTGRKDDFNSLLRDLGPTLGAGADLLGELNSDNLALRNLVTTTDGYVGELTAQRAKLVDLVDKVGGTAATVATHRAELRTTLANAPGGLRTLQTFLGRLEQATVPLGPAAEKIATSAVPLAQAQQALPAFVDAAVPALNTARDVAPDLTRLGREATPVLGRAVPAIDQLRSTAENDLPAVASTLNGSINNTVAVLENWARAIQYRDGLSHIFRGEASFAPDALISAVERVVGGARKGGRNRTRPGAQRPQGTGTAPAAPGRPATDTLKPVLSLLPQLGIDVTKLPTKPLTDQVAKTVDEALNGLGLNKQTSGLLDYLLKP